MTVLSITTREYLKNRMSEYETLSIQVLSSIINIEKKLSSKISNEEKRYYQEKLEQAHTHFESLATELEQLKNMARGMVEYHRSEEMKPPPGLFARFWQSCGLWIWSLFSGFIFFLCVYLSETYIPKPEFLTPFQQMFTLVSLAFSVAGLLYSLCWIGSKICDGPALT